MPKVTVFRDKFSRSWPRHERGTPAFVLDLPDALGRTYDTDVHFAAYATPNGRRLGREAIDAGIRPELSVVVFDVDCPGAHGSDAGAPDWWRADLREKVRVLSRRHPQPFYYETRGGARIVYLREPFTVDSHERARRWSQEYAVAVAYLRLHFGIEADPACGDWQRLFRAPRATRDGRDAPENFVVIGDAAQTGVLELTGHVTEEDISLAVQSSRAFYVYPQLASGYEPGCATSGLFYRLLYLRRDVFDEREPGVYVIRCPNEGEHTSGRTGDSSTLLYPPAGFHTLGVIHCKHAHCAEKTVHDWLRCFSEREHAAATDLLLAAQHEART